MMKTYVVSWWTAMGVVVNLSFNCSRTCWPWKTKGTWCFCGAEQFSLRTLGWNANKSLQIPGNIVVCEHSVVLSTWGLPSPCTGLFLYQQEIEFLGFTLWRTGQRHYFGMVRSIWLWSKQEQEVTLIHEASEFGAAPLEMLRQRKTAGPSWGDSITR